MKEFGPELLDKIENAEQATGLILSRLDWNNETGMTMSFDEREGAILDFIHSEFDELVNNPALISIDATNKRIILEYLSSGHTPTDLTIKNINQGLSDNNVELFLQRIKLTNKLVIKPREKRFFDDWDILDTGGNCDLRELYLGPIKIWVSSVDGCGVPKLGEDYQIGVYDKIQEERGSSPLSWICDGITNEVIGGCGICGI